MGASGDSGLQSQVISRNLPQGAMGTKTITEQWLNETEFEARIAELYSYGFNVQTRYEMGIYNITATIGSDINDEENSEPEEPNWTVSPQFVEKPLLESEVPIIKALSSDTIEALRFAVKNPKFNNAEITPSELTSYNTIRNILALGVEAIPYYTLTLSRTMLVNRRHFINWANPNVYDRFIYSKNGLISAYNIPAYVQVQMPDSLAVTLTNGVNAYWGYYPKRYSTRTAPKNQLEVTQEFLYDRWITSADMFTVNS